jgi:patatin-like phospholipase/acyl hydrolase
VPKPPQRKILSLDGGGIRGVISVEVLHRLETLLREQTGRPDLRLCDWFDLIAGTSTGAITAALLGLGHSVADIRRFYEEEAHVLFASARLRDRLRHSYDAGPLTRRLQEVLGSDTTLGSDRIRTLLLLVLYNATTDSPWFLTNNRAAKFNDRRLPACNLDLPLWQLVRASTAAPTYFGPETITLGDQPFVFSDGGLTGYNNPALKAVLIGTVEPYGLSWPARSDQLLVISVGTGTTSMADAELEPERMHLFHHATTLPHSLLSTAAQLQDMLCRVLGDCLSGEPIDLEVGDLIGAAGPASPKLFTYVRYDVALTRGGLDGIGCEHLEPEGLAALDSVRALDELRQVGEALARARVRLDHLKDFLRTGSLA